MLILDVEVLPQTMHIQMFSWRKKMGVKPLMGHPYDHNQLYQLFPTGICESD